MAKLTKKELKMIEDYKNEADILMTIEEFTEKYNVLVDTKIGKVVNMRFVVGNGQLKAFGYYAFLDSTTNKKVFVS